MSQTVMNFGELKDQKETWNKEQNEDNIWLQYSSQIVVKHIPSPLSMLGF